MINPKKVSVIIPSYNEEENICKAIRSALCQTYDDVEVLVVDDASTDNTIQKVRESFPQVNIIRHKQNLGGSAARNTGIKHSKGDYIALLDADDIWHPSKIEYQINTLEELNADWKAAYCGVHHSAPNKLIELIKNSMERNTPEGGEELIPLVLALKLNLGGSSTLIFEKELSNELGGFDEDFERHQDYEFVIRLLKNTKLAYVDHELVRKNSTGYPDPLDVEESKELLYDKFETEINKYEREGIPVQKYHNFDLARCHIRNGSLLYAIRLLSRSRPQSSLGYAGLGKAVLDRIL